MQYVLRESVSGDIGTVQCIWVSKAFIPEDILLDTIAVDYVPLYPELPISKYAKQFIKISTREIFYETYNQPLIDSERFEILEQQLTDTQVALVESYESNLSAQDEITGLQVALTEVYEQLWR